MESLEEITQASRVEPTPEQSTPEPAQYSGYAKRGAQAGFGLTLLLLGAALYHSATMREETLKAPMPVLVDYGILLGTATGIGAWTGRQVQDYRNNVE